ncbi:MAG: trypsin-like peptidase domain-containing protein [Candidatus Methanoperedens sp.]
MSDKVRLQNLRDFTVQIRHSRTNDIVGTGIVVSVNGEIVTCKHVVEDAGVNLTDAKGAEVGITFPLACTGEKLERRATVAGHFTEYHDDIVILQLIGSPPPLSEEKIAHFGDPRDSGGNPFQSYGYRRVDEYNCGYASGEIQGEIEPPPTRNLLSDPVELKSNDINHGMSGSAVLDKTRNLVVGIVSEIWDYPESTKNRDLAWAVNAKILTFDPIKLFIQSGSYPRRSAPQPKIDNNVAKKALVTKSEYLFSWDEVIGNEIKLLIEFLIKNFNVDWIKTAQIQKSDENRTINFFDLKNSLSFGINLEKMKAVLIICGLRTNDFIMKMENGKLNIYKLVFAFNNAPLLLSVWVGRDDLMKNISNDWYISKHHVVGLIGFGGEGKSSLARQWLHELIDDHLIKDTDPAKHPDGVFWWTFDDKRNVDEFFEAALYYLSGGNSDLLNEYTSPAIRVELIASMLRNGSYIFILDGLEVMQYQNGDQYGQLESEALRDFLGYVAAKKDIKSLCLITSRIPLVDLGNYTTYIYHNVDRLSPEDGRTLLRKLGVKGKDEELNKVVTEWDGHALTLNLLGTLLVKEYNGNIALMNKIPPPTAKGPYEPINQLFRYYDEHLKDPERAFLSIFSAFRTPVKESAFEPVFRRKISANALNSPIAALDESAFNAMLKCLVEYSLLRFDPQSHSYTAHPLIRAHYIEDLNEISRAQTVHRCIKDYYLTIAGSLPHVESPTIDDLKPLIEAVYHSCRAGEYEDGYKIYLDRIDQKQGILLYQLGAYETDLALMLEFFPNSDFSKEPLIINSQDKAYLIRSLGLCLMTVGRLQQALFMYEKSCGISLETEDLFNAGKTSQLLSELYIHLGNLNASIKYADQSLEYYRKTKDRWGDCCSLDHEMWGVQNAAMGTPQLTICCLSYKAWAMHLTGDKHGASLMFKQAEELAHTNNPKMHYLRDLWGIYHADHLQQIGDAGYAKQITEENLKYAKDKQLTEIRSQCHRVLGDIDARSELKSAKEHYDEALKIARNLTHRAVLIEALLGRGRWNAQHGYLKDALIDLEEALSYSKVAGYRIYEIDIDIVLKQTQGA